MELELQEALHWFAGQMAAKLEINSHKRGWNGLSERWILNRIRQELGELQRAVAAESGENIIREAADVANFCMMIANTQREAVREAGEAKR